MNITKEQFKKLAKKHLTALRGYDINQTMGIYGVEKLYDEIIKLEQHTETICPQCGSVMKFSGKTLLSNPQQDEYRCEKCKNIEYIVNK